MNTINHGKWAIFQVAPGVFRIEFYDSTGIRVVSRANFDRPAIEEFKARLDEVIKT